MSLFSGCGHVGIEVCRGRAYGQRNRFADRAGCAGEVDGVRRAPRPRGAPGAVRPSLDQALADLANRTARIVYFTPPQRRSPARRGRELAEGGPAFVSECRSERFQPASRSPYASRLRWERSSPTPEYAASKRWKSRAASRYVDFVKFCLQIFSEFPVYMTLEYPELIGAPATMGGGASRRRGQADGTRPQPGQGRPLRRGHRSN